MAMTLSILMDSGDVQKLTDYLGSMERRAARAELLPILKRHLDPLVASEKSFLGSHTVSGALALSLSARSGSGDRPGTISVFSASSATNKQLQSTWGNGRAQQRGWASKLKSKRGRRRVFYGPIVHQGHRIVKRNSAGQLYDTGKMTKPVPFAQQAMDHMGDAQAEMAANEIIDHILGNK